MRVLFKCVVTHNGLNVLRTILGFDFVALLVIIDDPLILRPVVAALHQ